MDLSVHLQHTCETMGVHDELVGKIMGCELCRGAKHAPASSTFHA